MPQRRPNTVKKYNKYIFQKNSTEGKFTIQNLLNKKKKKSTQFTVRFFFKTKKKVFFVMRTLGFTLNNFHATYSVNQMSHV